MNITRCSRFETSFWQWGRVELKLRFAIVTICIVLVSILSLHAELPIGVAQQAVTVTSLSFVTVTVPSLITVSRVSYVTVMGAVSYVTQTVLGPVSYVTQTVVQPHQRQDDRVMIALYKIVSTPSRSELLNSPAPIPEYTNVWPILLICMIFILVSFRSKVHKHKSP